MSRRHKHEEHTNHEAWAIPYGDLVTLLLAFFVVMYAMSSVNEGKYRVLSDSLVAAFRGSPKTMEPIQVGEKQVGSGADIRVTLVQQGMLEGQPRSLLHPPPVTAMNDPRAGATQARSQKELDQVANDVEEAMAALIDQDLVIVRRHGTWVEVEIRTDILFASGVAILSKDAEVILQKLAATLKPYPNPVRVEGHTDNLPIRTASFPSNWELSAARAASVVHLFTREGMNPARLAVIGLAEFRPATDNTTIEGRNANRRVVLAIMGTEGAAPEGNYADERGEPSVPPTAEVPSPVVETASAPGVVTTY